MDRRLRDPAAPGRITGGTGILKAQAECGFKAWGNLPRGRARSERPAHSFPDPLDRGSLLHDALQRFAEHAPDRERAHDNLTGSRDRRDCTCGGRELLRTFPDAISRRRRLRAWSPCSTAWRALETQRPPYQVQSVETVAECTLDGWTFNVRVDRLDLIDEKLLVIDYKTGNVGLSGVLTIPLLEPQLAAYAQLADAIRGVTYAQIGTEPRVLVSSTDTLEDQLGHAPAIAER